MNTSRKIYRRRLELQGILCLILFGMVSAGIAGAFVVLKNREHSLANQKGAIEMEIEGYSKKIETLDLRIAAMIDRDAIAARLPDFDTGLVKIERAVKVFAEDDGGEQFASYLRAGESSDEF